MTAPTPDAVAQALERFYAAGGEYARVAGQGEPAGTDAATAMQEAIGDLIAAVERRVRAECAAKVRAVETTVETYSPRCNYQRNPDAVKAEILAALEAQP